MRLADLRKPLEEVEFLSGTKITPVPFGPPEYALWREIEHEIKKGREAGSAQKIGDNCLTIIRACYPDVTDDDLVDCDPEMLLALTAYPGAKIDMVRTALKNVAAVEPAPDTVPPATPPSSPTTSGSTSSPKSRKRSAKTGGERTTVSPTDAPSSSGTPTTGSTSLSGSIPSAVKWTTSTARSSPPTL